MNPWLTFFYMVLGKRASATFLRVLVLATPFINMFNGWWLEAYGRSLITPGQILAAIFIIYGTLLVVLRKSPKLKFLILMCATFVPSLVSGWFIGGHTVASMVWYSRIYYTAMIYCIFLLAADSESSMDNFRKLLAYAGAIVGWSLVICKIAGLGESTYSMGVGFKGLYYAQNELSATIVMLFPFTVEHLLRSRKSIALLNCSITFSSMMIIGTKSTLAFGILTLIILLGSSFYRSNFVRTNITSGRKIVYLTCTFVIVAVLLIVFRRSVAQIFEYQQYFFDHRGFLAYLTSGRTYTLPILWSVLKAYPWASVIGVGYNGENLLLSRFAGTPTILEFDPLTLLLAGGIISVVSCMIIFSHTIHAMFSRMFINEKALFISLLFGIISSLVAGHVLASSIAGTYLAVVAGFYSYRFNEEFTPTQFTSLKADSTKDFGGKS